MRAIAAVVVVTAGLAGCTSTDPVASYLDDVEEVTRRLTDESAIAIPPGSPPTYEGVAGVVAARRRALTSLEALDPPDELDAEHRALVTVLGDHVTAAEGFIDQTASLGPEAFRQALDASTDLDILAGRVADACDAMRRRARTLGHAVTLEC